MLRNLMPDGWAMKCFWNKLKMCILEIDTHNMFVSHIVPWSAELIGRHRKEVYTFANQFPMDFGSWYPFDPISFTLLKQFTKLTYCATT
jgi:hypothetical protein